MPRSPPCLPEEQGENLFALGSHLACALCTLYALCEGHHEMIVVLVIKFV